MTRCLFWIAAISFIGVTTARTEDCENPPAVKHATIQIEDDEDTVHAIYTCSAGYELQGNRELICDLDTDEWDTEAPTCVKGETNNVVVEETTNNNNNKQRKKKPQDIIEDNKITAEWAANLDMSCVQAKIKAPEIRHGFVQKYDRRRKNDKIFLVALYTCNEHFEFEDTAVNTLYCSERKWVGDLPVCVRLGEYTEGEEEEEYDDYERVGEDEEEEEEEEEDDGDENIDADVDVRSNTVAEVAPPPPPPPTEVLPPPPPPTEALPPTIVIEEELSNEILPKESETSNKASSQHIDHEENNQSNAVTDINIVVEPTKDPYTPRLLDENCGVDKGGCEQKCERLLFPGENEPRLKCSCFDGFSLDPYDYSRCHDIDECQLNNGGCEQICNNLPGSFQCTCEQGLQIDTLTGKTCVDINECLLRNGHGPCQDTCHNLWASYRCSCAGLPGTQLAADNHTCEDAGVCSNSAGNGGCSHICLSSLGKIFCLCPSGFRLDENDGKNCLDINECELPEVAENCAGVCENTRGSYRCIPALNTKEEAIEEKKEKEEEETEEEAAVVSKLPDNAPFACPTGHRVSSENNNQCVDIDECAEGLSGCEHCLNTEGAFECTCPAGYELADDEKHCVDINECEIVVEDESQDGVPYKVCNHGCENTPGSYNCFCEGSHFHLAEDRRSCLPYSCQDLKNPQLNKTRCAYECVDLPSGAYECVCPAGYKLGEDLHSCEVATSACTREDGYQRCQPGTCLANEDNTDFNCICPQGYANSADFHSCQDIDECKGIHQCSHECANTPGSYQCSCPNGFRFVSGSEHQCEDIDECLTDPNICGELNCVNKPGAFSCFCKSGAAPDAVTGLCDQLEELDVCKVNNNGCDQLCKSEEQGSCACQSGYILGPDGKSCLDIDECQISNGGCHQRCRNLPGGYECACEPGFEFLAGSLQSFCFDIDECTSGTHNCGTDMKCENLNGSFTCLCPAGYAIGLPPARITLQSLLSSTSLLYPETSFISPLAPSCLDIDECSIANGNCSHFCLNFPGSFQCACPDTHKLDISNNRTCLALASCLHGNGNCSHQCTELDGHIQCACPTGMALEEDGHNCADIDECRLENGECAQVCENTVGSFACSCRIGFELAANGRDCLDIDECAHGYGNCTFICINLLGSYACACEAGFQLADDQITCIDIDECVLHRHDCSHDCINIDGGYECGCRSGYLLSEDRATCLDMDECALHNGGCSHICRNLVGAHECACPEGYHLIDTQNCGNECPAGFSASPKGCVDIDECATPGICQYQCLNNNGSYECICPPGYRLRNGKECEDIDECATDNGGCIGGECINHNGGHECRCPVGQRLASDRRTCERRTEVRDQCTKLLPPQNGEIHCTKYRHKKKLFYNTKCKVWCKQGYHLQGPAQRYCNASGIWDAHENLCLPNVCQSLPAPRNGIILPPSCTTGTTALGEQCRLQCTTGHVPIEKSVTVCMTEERWSHNQTFDCKPVKVDAVVKPPTSTYFFNRPLNRPQIALGSESAFGVHQAHPYIKCPRNTTVFLPRGENTAHIILQKPLTNLDFRYIESHPAWTKNLQAHLGVGTYEISFRGRDPLSGKHAKCHSVIQVRRAEPPRVTFCTPSFDVSLGVHQAYRAVAWEEPRFETSSGGLKKLYKSRIPGELFGPGIHTVYYEATNEEGLTSRCEFKINVKSVSTLAVSPVSIFGLPYGNSAPAAISMPSPILHTNVPSARTLPGHESFVICPGQAPVKVTQGQSVDLPVGCILKNVRINPLRQYLQRYLISPRWVPFSSF